MASDSLGVPESIGAPVETKILSRREKASRWLIIIGTVILAIFLVYLLLIVIYPSLNIGMSS